MPFLPECRCLAYGFHILQLSRSFLFLYQLLSSVLPSPRTELCGLRWMQNTSGIYPVAQKNTALDKNAISRQPCETFTHKFPRLFVRDTATVLKKGCLNTLCQVFNFAGNSQRAVVLFSSIQTTKLILQS